jgi:outer membrane protein TolC
MAGCAQYQPLVLPQQPDFVPGNAVQGSSTLSLPDGLSLAQLQRRVQQDNPELKAAKLGAMIKAAELRKAGTLPDPALSVTLDKPLNGVGLINAMNQSISMDLSAIISRHERLNAARAAQIQQALNFTWLGLTTQMKASDLYVQKVANKAQTQVLARELAELNTRLQQSQKALVKGYITQDRVVAFVVRSADLARQVDILQLQATQLHQQMNALMGMAPDATWHTQGWPRIPEPDAAEQTLMIAQLPAHRPDLLALRAGVLQADARYRAAILQQFPGLTLGFSRANDTSNVQTAGLSFGLTLPIFGSAQAGAALAQATRAQLTAEFQARINQAVSDVAAVQTKLLAYRARLTQIEARLPTLEKTAANAQTALNAGYFSAGSYLAVRATLTAEQLNAIQTRQAIIQAQLALRGVLGLEAQPREPQTAINLAKPAPSQPSIILLKESH